MTNHPRSEFEGYRPLFTQSDGRRFQRVTIGLSGRCMFESRLEYPCETVDISPGGMRLSAPVIPRIGEKVIAYINGLGRFEGPAIRELHDGFAITFKAPAAKRESLADKLTWFANRLALDIAEERRHLRIEPFMRRAIMRFPDGREHLIKILNFSNAGIAVETSAPPQIGAQILIGKTEVLVLRHFEGGFAGQFVTPFSPREIHEATVL